MKNFQPRETSMAAPVAMHSPSFAKPPVEDRRIDDLKRQLDSMNTKLDNLLRMIATPEEKKEEPKKAPAPKKKTTKKK